MSDEKDLVVALRAEWIARKIMDFDDWYDRLSQQLDSPIERVLFAAFILEEPMPCVGTMSFPGTKELIVFEETAADLAVHLYCQHSIGPYRVDFYLEGYSGSGLFFRAAVECDGHDFHERTKEQARRDKRRDRWFQTRGIIILRFTGSEIWADPSSCAEQTYDVFWEALGRHAGPRRL